MTLRKPTTLQWALGVSLAIHGVLLTLRLVDPEAFARMVADQPLEVILVNARGHDKPVKAQALAQTSLAGGGDVDVGRATSPLPASALTAIGESLDVDPTRKVQTLQEQQNVLLAQVKRQLAALAQPEAGTPTERLDQTEREEKRKQLMKLLAEIERRINLENARPKKRYVAPSVQESVYAVYYDNFKQLVEARGTQNFPQIAGKKLYGELTMVITINHDGRLVDTEIAQGSGSTALDTRAAAIVRSAGAFGTFTPQMRKEFDQLVVVSRFRFTREETLEAKVSGAP